MSERTTTYLISGASRGLGLETARQLLALSPSNRIIAAVRCPETATELQELVSESVGRIEAVKLDVADSESVKAGIAEIEALDIAKNGIDVLINNAGIMTGSSGSFSWAPATACPTSNLEEILKVNLFGAMNLTLATLPLLRRGRDKKIFTTSSLLASMGGPITQSEAMGAGAAHYAVSKAAVNMYFVKLAKELAAEQFTVVLYDPGYVKTDMNGGLAGSAEIYKEESVEKTLKNIILTKGPADSGKFFNSTAENPW